MVFVVADPKLLTRLNLTKRTFPCVDRSSSARRLPEFAPKRGNVESRREKYRKKGRCKDAADNAGQLFVPRNPNKEKEEEDGVELLIVFPPQKSPKRDKKAWEAMRAKADGFTRTRARPATTRDRQELQALAIATSIAPPSRAGARSTWGGKTDIDQRLASECMKHHHGATALCRQAQNSTKLSKTQGAHQQCLGVLANVEGVMGDWAHDDQAAKWSVLFGDGGGNRGKKLMLQRSFFAGTAPGYRQPPPTNGTRLFADLGLTKLPAIVFSAGFGFCRDAIFAHIMGILQTLQHSNLSYVGLLDDVTEPSSTARTGSHGVSMSGSVADPFNSGLV